MFNISLCQSKMQHFPFLYVRALISLVFATLLLPLLIATSKYISLSFNVFFFSSRSQNITPIPFLYLALIYWIISALSLFPIFSHNHKMICHLNTIQICSSQLYTHVMSYFTVIVELVASKYCPSYNFIKAGLAFSSASISIQIKRCRASDSSLCISFLTIQTLVSFSCYCCFVIGRQEFPSIPII